MTKSGSVESAPMPSLALRTVVSRDRRSSSGDASAYRGWVPKTEPKTAAKTKTGSPKRVGNRFWKLLGASTDRDQNRSSAQVRSSEDFDEKAAKLDDGQLRKAAKLLVLDELAESADIPQFLAIAREASE